MKSDKTLEIQYHEVSIKTVIDYFIKGCRENGNRIQRYEPFVDTAKGKIILKLFVEKGGE